jgi:hypothetical protein
VAIAPHYGVCPQVLITAVTRLLTNSVLELARLDAAEKRG